jgi:hypothetical protein
VVSREDQCFHERFAGNESLWRLEYLRGVLKSFNGEFEPRRAGLTLIRRPILEVSVANPLCCGDLLKLGIDSAYGEAFIRSPTAMGYMGSPNLRGYLSLGSNIFSISLAAVKYCKEVRPHLALKKDAPIPRDVQRAGRVLTQAGCTTGTSKFSTA